MSSGIAIGNYARASGIGAIAFGAYSEAEGDHAMAIGYRAKAIGKGAIAIGDDMVAEGDGVVRVMAKFAPEHVAALRNLMEDVFAGHPETESVSVC